MAGAVAFGAVALVDAALDADAERWALVDAIATATASPDRRLFQSANSVRRIAFLVISASADR